MAAAHKNRGSDAAEPSFQLFKICCKTLASRQIEVVHQIRVLDQRCGREAGHAVPFDDGVDLGIGKPGKNGFACGGAMRVETSADGRPRGDDGIQAIDPIETDDASCSRHGNAHTFIAAPGHLHQECVRFTPECPGFQGAASQFVQLQSQPVPFVLRILFDELEFPHGIEKAVDGGFIQTEFVGKLCDAHLGTVFAEM